MVFPQFAQTPDLMIIERCFAELRPLERSTTPEAERRRNAIEIVLATRYAPLLPREGEPAATMLFVILERRRAELERMASRHPAPTADEIRRAEADLAPLIAQAQNPFGKMTSFDMAILLLTMVAVTLALTALVGLASALALPGGAMLRVLGMAVVGEDGAQISRGRSVARAAIAWAPAFAAAASLMILMPSAGIARWAALALALTALTLFVGGAVIAFVNPERGYRTDCAAPTWCRDDARLAHPWRR